MNQLLAIRAFLRLAEAGSFTKVADQLALPRSTVSKLISDLEQHLGTKLVQRTTRVAVLTAEGESYYSSVSGPLADLDEADHMVRGKRSNTQGTLRVDVTSSFASLFLIDRLSDFRRRFPGLVLELGISDRTVDIVGEWVDCAIRVGELNDTTLVSRRLFTAQTSLCASRAYIERKGIPQTIEDLYHHDLVGYFRASNSRPMPITFELPHGREELRNFSVMANDSAGHIQMMLAGLGIGQEIRPLMKRFIDTGELVPILDELSQPQIDYYLLYPSIRHKSARLKLFIDWIVEQIDVHFGR